MVVKVNEICRHAKTLRKYYHRNGWIKFNKICSTSILTISDHIKKKYSRPVGYGNNLSEQVIWQMNDNTGS